MRNNSKILGVATFGAQGHIKCNYPGLHPGSSLYSLFEAFGNPFKSQPKYKKTPPSWKLQKVWFIARSEGS